MKIEGIFVGGYQCYNYCEAKSRILPYEII